MSEEIEQLVAESEQRIAEAQRAEADLLEHLKNLGLTEVWQKVRARLHCERFLESRTGKTVVDRLIRTITDAQNEWLLASDPTSKEVIEAHRRATAAHMAIFALDEILADGGEAEADLIRIEQELGE